MGKNGISGSLWEIYIHTYATPDDSKGTDTANREPGAVLKHDKFLATAPEPRLIEFVKTDQLAVFGCCLRRELNHRLSWQGQPRPWRAGENARVCPWRHQLSSIRFMGGLDFSSPIGEHNDQAEPELWCVSVTDFYYTLHR